MVHGMAGQMVHYMLVASPCLCSSRARTLFYGLYHSRESHTRTSAGQMILAIDMQLGSTISFSFFQCGHPCFLILLRWCQHNIYLFSLYHPSSCGVSLSLIAINTYVQEVEKEKHKSRTKWRQPQVPFYPNFHWQFSLQLWQDYPLICFLLSLSLLFASGVDYILFFLLLFMDIRITFFF